MHTIPKTFIAALLLFLGLGIFFFILNKPKPVAPPAPVVEQESTNVVRDYEEKISREREIEQDRLFEERKQQKLAVAKKNSVECQFWKQQKPSKKTDDKIAEHCDIQTAAQ
jgi:hypothetical protein